MSGHTTIQFEKECIKTLWLSVKFTQLIQSSHQSCNICWQIFSIIREANKIRAKIFFDKLKYIYLVAPLLQRKFPLSHG